MNRTLERDADSAKTAIDSLVSEIERLENDNKDKDAKIDSLENIIEDKNNMIESLEEKIQTLEDYNEKVDDLDH